MTTKNPPANLIDSLLSGIDEIFVERDLLSHWQRLDERGTPLQSFAELLPPNPPKDYLFYSHDDEANKWVLIDVPGR